MKEQIENQAIEEMAFDLRRIDACKRLPKEECYKTTCFHCEAEAFYNAGYRKQSEGEWHWIADDSPMCNICGNVFDTNDNADAGLWNYCPNCGSHMRGGKNE